MTTLPPRLRSAALTVHIASSVGWLGAVIAVLALAVAARTSPDVATVSAAFVAMELIGRAVLVPLALASLLTGVAQSLGTPWGLLQHYWVLAKLLLTAVATAVLLAYLETLDLLADIAAGPAPDLAALRTSSVVLHSGAALLVLLVITALAIFKPRGMTRYGQRRRHAQRRAAQA